MPAPTTATELTLRLSGKHIRITGLHPGKDQDAYAFQGTFAEAWDVHSIQSRIGFSACHHTWPGIDYWREGPNGELFGFYTALAFPPTEPGFVCIVEDTDELDG